VTDQAVERPPDMPLACDACRVIDAADGSEDGKFFAPPAHSTQHEGTLIRSLAKAQDRAADRVTEFAGSLKFVYLHSAWFGVWVLVNIGLLSSAIVFDKYPFGLLTMIVSLEAIFLSTFVMVSQNRQAGRAEVRSDLDFANNLRAEIWAIHIGTQLGIDHEHVEETVRAILARQPDAMTP
jgi:uncharacterized membrane protein